MRLLLFTGKGGVGKTSVAAATALAAADAGARTLVLSTDAAHSLADAFDRPIGSTPTKVTERLFAQQLDVTERFEETWGEVRDHLVEVMGWAGVDVVEAEELAVLPGLDEVFALIDIADHAASGAWEVIVVDCAPTAETIRLLSLPEVLGWYVKRAFPATRRLARVARPLLGAVSSLPPVAPDAVFTALERLVARLAEVRTLLTGEQASLRLVVNPEKMVIAEARRTSTYLALFGYGVDAVVANRLLPEAVQDPWFKAWREAHAEHLAAIEDGFAPLPVLRADLASDELVGLERLRAFGDDLYDGVDATAVLHEGEGLTVARRPDGTTVLRMPLPFCDHDELEVGRRDDELLVRVGPYRRAVVLPDSLRRRAVVAASLRGDALEVEFGEAP